MLKSSPDRSPKSVGDCREASSDGAVEVAQGIGGGRGIPEKEDIDGAEGGSQDRDKSGADVEAEPQVVGGCGLQRSEGRRSG